MSEVVLEKWQCEEILINGSDVLQVRADGCKMQIHKLYKQMSQSAAIADLWLIEIGFKP